MNVLELFPMQPRSLLVTGFLLGAMVVAALSTAPPDDPSRRLSRPNISSFHLPKELDFCGEFLPLEIRDVRKRMDREFLLNLQWDGQVMLYLRRSGEYFDLFERILKEEEAPDDLKFLSVAESALFMAQSSKGAVGLWQFIPETARRYGLRVDDEVDERRHPEKSTRSAIRYLKENYKRFGSWALAACAYNQGEAGTADDLAFQRGSSYFDLYLNEETSRYLFRIVAIKEIMLHPERYGYYLERGDYYQPTPSRPVTVESSIPNLAAWADQQGTTYKEVKILNPWILRRSLPSPGSSGSGAILIPVNEE